jgi:hypothetical protein
LEHTFSPTINDPEKEDGNENEHFIKNRRDAIKVDKHPGKKKNSLYVENQE